MTGAAPWKVLVSAPRAVADLARYERELAAAGCEVVAARAPERLEEADLLPLVADVDGMICGDDRITRRVLDAAPRLRVISKWGTGIDSIDVEEARRRGIAVCNSPGAFREPVADTVMGYVLMFARRLDAMSADMRQGGWRRLPARALGECTLGIVGLGATGRAVAKRAQAFGMRLLAHTVDALPPAHLAGSGAALVPLDRLLRESDFVTLHADLRADNHRMIGAAQLALMKRDAVLVNTARGGLVDETALVEALRAGRIGGAALDVFEVEPLPADSELRRLPNVHLAPHNANAGADAAERVHQNTIRNLLQALGART